MASDDMLSWLRNVIEGDKSLAEVAASSERYGVRYTGHWTYTPGDDLVYQDGRRGPGVAGIVGRSCACCGPASLGHPHDLMHVATHDPRDTIARCEAELAILALYNATADYSNLHPLDTQVHAAAKQLSVAIALLASGYMHREGFKREWLVP